VAHISTGVEYALHCLLYLADPANAAPASARDLADLQGIPAEYVAKVFTRLEKAGLVVAIEGLRGGFRLARRAEAISVLDVVDAIEGAKPLFDCREIRGSCVLFAGTAWKPRGVCAIHAVMLEAVARMREALAAHSLADLATRVAAKLPARFGDDVADWLAARAAARRARNRTIPRTKEKR
jgi:Rrf2 family protein